MDRFLYVMAVVLMVGVGACVQEPEGSSVMITRADSAGVEIVTITGSVVDLPVWGVSGAPLYEVSGELPPHLGSVGELTFAADGGLLIEDNQAAALHRFDSTGRHARAFARRGDGPGEIRAVGALLVGRGDTVWAFDRRHSRLMAFAPDGGLAREVSIGREVAGPTTITLQAWALGSGGLVVHSLGPGDNTRPSGPTRREQRDAALQALDGTGSPTADPILFPGGYSIQGDGTDFSTPLSNEPFVSVSGENVLHGSGLTYELTMRRGDLQPVRVIRWSGWGQPLTDDQVQALREEFDAGLAELREVQPDFADAWLEALFSPDVLPAQLPVLGRAFLDNAGRIWVSAFQVDLGRWEEHDIWHVLSADGVPLARILLPDGSRLAAVRDDRLAVIVRDELDVEHVRVFEVSPLREAP